MHHQIRRPSSHHPNLPKYVNWAENLPNAELRVPTPRLPTTVPQTMECPTQIYLHSKNELIFPEFHRQMSSQKLKQNPKIPTIQTAPRIHKCPQIPLSLTQHPAIRRFSSKHQAKSPLDSRSTVKYQRPQKLPQAIMPSHIYPNWFTPLKDTLLLIIHHTISSVHAHRLDWRFHPAKPQPAHTLHPPFGHSPPTKFLLKEGWSRTGGKQVVFLLLKLQTHLVVTQPSPHLETGTIPVHLPSSTGTSSHRSFRDMAQWKKSQTGETNNDNSEHSSSQRVPVQERWGAALSIHRRTSPSTTPSLHTLLSYLQLPTRSTDRLCSNAISLPPLSPLSIRKTRLPIQTRNRQFQIIRMAPCTIRHSGGRSSTSLPLHQEMSLMLSR
ncbi:hypothetical protein BLNAU_6455 [Blattamonas nauphoetae]|uniref:Uncharacterized protein n=1 Tax=Blattamonas nauphoetae TaxID=2049346 RepID=A0ABQ9Y4L5_9EUKA|nr:hypothetical protein BLNAU_6455 [Blattamonas nauphoetae]